MAEYLGRTGSCTEGRFYPDTNLEAYARSHSFQTALIGAKFKGTNKIYTYWGHTGMKRGDYARVLVPRRGSRQEEVVVRVVAVIPAAELKQAGGRTAKHIQSVLVGHIPPNMKIPLPSESIVQGWCNVAAFDIVPAPMTEHAKACVAEIDNALTGKQIDQILVDDLVIEDVLALDEVNEQLRPTKEDRVDAMQFALNGNIDGSIDWKVGTAALDLKTLSEHYASIDRHRDFYQQYMLQPMYSEDGQNLKRHASFSPAHAASYGAGSCSMKSFDHFQQEHNKANVASAPPIKFLQIHEPWRLYQWYMQQRCLRVDYVSSTGIYTIVGDDSARAIPEKARNWLEGERSQRRIREKAARLGAMYSSGPNDMLAFAEAINPDVRLTQSQEEMLVRAHALMQQAVKPKPLEATTPKETIVSAKIETIVYVTLPGNNARLVAKDVPASTYFDAIATLEAQIGKLELIEHKPRSLQQQVAALKTQVQELAELCDLYHAKKEPILGQTDQADSKDASGDATVGPNPGTAA